MPTLTWVGKDKVVNHHHDVPFRLLDKKYTFKAKAGTSDNSTSNRIIHGDNLEALKSLLPEFEGKVKCIYIDPPYNTGNEGWVYNDAVNDPRIKKWLGQVVGKEGEDLSRHDKWLCMMYPRLKLLHRLLANDGVIFVSIDAFEFGLLKILMDEIFGLQNFKNCISVRRGIKNVQSQFEDLKALSLGHEYIFLYSKVSTHKLPKLSKSHDEVKAGKWDTFWRGTDRPTMRYELLGVKPESGQWRWEKNRSRSASENYQAYLSNFSSSMTLDDYFLDHLTATNEKIDFVRLNEDGVVQYYVPPQNGKLASDQWMDITLSGQFTEFDTEKNIALLDRIVSWITADSPNAVVLDSFAGSGTTAHSVLKLNIQDGGNRRFILCELMDYAETITAERIRRVMDGYGKGTNAVVGTGGCFDFYTVGEPLFLEDKNLNEAVGVDAIRNYVSYTEGIPTLSQAAQNTMALMVSPYALGLNETALWLFYYEREKVTTLNIDFLASLNIKKLTMGGGKRPETYIIYADKCALDKAFITRHGIVFKRIPRDITKF